jgi:hypothetical protein
MWKGNCRNRKEGTEEKDGERRWIEIGGKRYEM